MPMRLNSKRNSEDYDSDLTEMSCTRL